MVVIDTHLARGGSNRGVTFHHSSRQDCAGPRSSEPPPRPGPRVV